LLNTSDTLSAIDIIRFIICIILESFIEFKHFWMGKIYLIEEIDTDREISSKRDHTGNCERIKFKLLVKKSLTYRPENALESPAGPGGCEIKPYSSPN
jgi:hypothetical protein